MFASLADEALRKWGLLLKKGTSPRGENSFHLEMIAIGKGNKIEHGFHHLEWILLFVSPALYSHNFQEEEDISYWWEYQDSLKFGNTSLK